MAAEMHYRDVDKGKERIWGGSMSIEGGLHYSTVHVYTSSVLMIRHYYTCSFALLFLGCNI